MPLDATQQQQGGREHKTEMARSSSRSQRASSRSPRASSRSPQSRGRDRSEEAFSASTSALSVTLGASRSFCTTNTVSKHELVSMDDVCWFRSGPEAPPVKHSESPIAAPLPFGLQAIVRPVNRPADQPMPCLLVFKHSEIRMEQNLLAAAPIELPRGTVLKTMRYPQVTFMGELTPIEGPGVVLRLSEENKTDSVVVEVSGMTRGVAETIRSILEARGSPMFIADW